jgi:TonB family protein
MGLRRSERRHASPIFLALTLSMVSPAGAQTPPAVAASAASSVSSPAASSATEAAPNAKALEAATNAQRVADSSLVACLKKVPEYPIAGRRFGLEGRTMLLFVVSAEGVPGEPAVLRSSGHGVLDNAALKHMRACIQQFELGRSAPLPPGRFALPMIWRLE